MVLEEPAQPEIRIEAAHGLHHRGPRCLPEVPAAKALGPVAFGLHGPTGNSDERVPSTEGETCVSPADSRLLATFPRLPPSGGSGPGYQHQLLRQRPVHSQIRRVTSDRDHWRAGRHILRWPTNRDTIPT